MSKLSELRYLELDMESAASDLEFLRKQAQYYINRIPAAEKALEKKKQLLADEWENFRNEVRKP